MREVFAIMLFFTVLDVLTRPEDFADWWHKINPAQCAQPIGTKP